VRTKEHKYNLTQGLPEKSKLGHQDQEDHKIRCDEVKILQTEPTDHIACTRNQPTVCPQSPLGVLKNCGAQTNCASHMRFAADYSETLKVFFSDADIWNKRPSLCFSVSCL
jgi:hypothetical protein